MNKKLLLTIIVAVAMLFVLTACKVEPQSIIIENEPTKTQYFVGEKTLSLEGGLLEVTYSNDKKEKIDLTDDEVEVSGFNTSTPGDVTITVSYKELTANFTIQVNAVVALSYTVINEPAKTQYYSLEEADVSDGMFRIEYNNGTFADVAMNNSGFNIVYDFTQTGETEITVNFLGFSHTVEVTVLEGPDWELIGDMTEKAIGHIYLLEEPQFLYCYFRLMEEVDKVYATESLKVVVYYIDNYFEGVEEVKQLCEENTYYYAPEFFNDEVLNEYIRLFTDLIYKWKTVEGYGVNSQEFCTQTEQLIFAYQALSRYQRWTFIFNMYSAYDYYIEVTAEYYSQYLSEQELEVYKMLVQSEFYYNGSKAADYGYHIDLFIRRTRDLIKLYEALSDSETFDELFLEEYNVYGDYLIELDPYAEEIYELNDFTIEITLGLILKILAGGDLSHLIVSYEIFFEMVQAIYDSDDADLIYEFETATVGNTTLYAKYEKYLEEYNALMEEISAKGEEFVEFYRSYLDIYRKWIEAGAGMSEKAGPADREMYPEFDTDVENFTQELEQLPQDLYDYFMSIANASYTKILKDHTDNS